MQLLINTTSPYARLARIAERLATPAEGAAVDLGGVPR